MGCPFQGVARWAGKGGITNFPDAPCPLLSTVEGGIQAHTRRPRPRHRSCVCSQVPAPPLLKDLGPHLLWRHTDRHLPFPVNVHLGPRLLPLCHGIADGQHAPHADRAQQHLVLTRSRERVLHVPMGTAEGRGHSEARTLCSYKGQGWVSHRVNTVGGPCPVAHFVGGRRNSVGMAVCFGVDCAGTNPKTTTHSPHHMQRANGSGLSWSRLSETS